MRAPRSNLASSNTRGKSLMCIQGLRPPARPRGLALRSIRTLQVGSLNEESCLPSMCGWALQLCQLPEHRSADAARKHKAVEQLLRAHSRQIT